MKSLCVAAAVLSGLFAGNAQTPTGQAQTASIQGGTEEVVLDVVVRDKKGKPVKGLKAGDFTVLDNGAPRTIKSFRRIEGTEAVSSSGARSQLDPLRQLRLITLVFQGGDATARKLAKDAAMELLKGELAQNVYISVMVIDNTLQAILPFTNDRDALKQAIGRATTLGTDFTSDTLRVRRQLAVQLKLPEAAGDASVNAGTLPLVDDLDYGENPPSTIPAGPSTTPPDAAASAARMEEIMMYNILLDAQADSQITLSRSSVFPLLDLVKEQYRLPGRKTIIFFSAGFPLQQDTEDAFKAIISIANRSNVSFYCLDINGLTTSSTNQQVLSAFRHATASEALNVNGSGSGTTGVTAAQAEALDSIHEAGTQDTQNTLDILSEQTGGSLIANTNDYRGPIHRALEDAESYYEITYAPQIAKYDGSFRKVAVKTDLKDLRVQTRAGYFALPPHMAPGQVLAPYEVPLLQALDARELPREFVFHSAAMHFRGPNGPVCEVVVDIPVASLSFSENKDTGAFDGKVAFVALIKDSGGRVVKKVQQQMPLRIDRNSLAAFQATSHFIHNESFPLPMGRYTLEAAAIDLQSQKLSARKLSFALPAVSGSLGISSVALVRNVTPRDAAAKPDNPMLMADKIVTPMIAETLQKKDYDSVPFYLTIYPDRENPEKPTLRIEFSKDGAALGSAFQSIGAADADGRIQYVANTPLEDVSPGHYQFRFLVKQGAEEAAETVTFTIE
jgi:VWFA-related protein